MDSEQICCRVISPMFSYGNGGSVEPRPTELKGLLRYIYRIASVETNSQKVYEKETRLFGGHITNKQGEVALIASPIRLQMRYTNLENSTGSNKARLMLHDAKDPRNNSPKSCYAAGGTCFQVGLSVNQPSGGNGQTLAFYKQIFLLSLVLGGIGKRSRRGRGCMAVSDIEAIPQTEFLQWIANALNSIVAVDGRSGTVYIAKESTTVFSTLGLTESTPVKRPVIEEVRLGKKISNVTIYLKAVDEASHTIKTRYPNNGGIFITGFAGKDAPGRFTSSIIVSIAQIQEGLFPLYTIVKPVFNGAILNHQTHMEEREDFIRLIEEGGNP